MGSSSEWRDAGHPVLWLDLETCGLAHTDPVLEVAAVLTLGAHFDVEVGRVDLTVLPAGGLRVDDLDPWVRETHTRTCLFSDVLARGVLPHVAWGALRTLLDQAPLPGFRVPLGGSGVAQFDIHVLRAQSDLADDAPGARLAYWSIDVGPLRRMADALGVELPVVVDGWEPDIARDHRAMHDALSGLHQGRQIALAVSRMRQ